MAKRDYYEVLGLELNCNPQDIRKSYRNLALKWHPDKHFHKKEAASKFNEIHEAYKVLTDVDQRKVYDKYGHAGLQRLQENEEYPNQAQFFFTKGFQGSDKSAFEVLYDILFERDEEDSASQKNTDLNSDFENFMKEQFFEDETDEFEFLSNYTPTFQDPDFMFTLPVFGQERSASTSTSTRNHKTQQTNNIQPSNQNIRSSTSGFNVNTMSFNSASSPFIVIEDNNEEENYDNFEYGAYDIPNNHIHQNSFMSQLNQFQNFLDDFHRTIEEDLGQFGQVNSASKKIYKKEKMGKPSYDNKKEQARDYTIPTVPIFS